MKECIRPKILLACGHSSQDTNLNTAAKIKQEPPSLPPSLPPLTCAQLNISSVYKVHRVIASVRLPESIIFNPKTQPLKTYVDSYM